MNNQQILENGGGDVKKKGKLLENVFGDRTNEMANSINLNEELNGSLKLLQKKLFVRSPSTIDYSKQYGRYNASLQRSDNNNNSIKTQRTSTNLGKLEQRIQERKDQIRKEKQLGGNSKGQNNTKTTPPISNLMKGTTQIPASRMNGFQEGGEARDRKGKGSVGGVASQRLFANPELDVQ